MSIKWILVRRCISVAIVSNVVQCVILPAHANVTISSQQTQNMFCSNGVCAPTAAKAVLSANDLETFLASGDITVVTTGQEVQANDIDIKAPVIWSNNSGLTLSAWKSIGIDQAVTVLGTSSLTLMTKKGALSFGKNGNVTIANLASSLSINGAAYTLVSDIKTLASNIVANPSGDFALASAYNASADGTYTNSPISTPFTGIFNGLGNTISNLSVNGATIINNQYMAGMFADLGTQGRLADVSLAKANFVVAQHRNSVGGGMLVGWNMGAVQFCHAAGVIAAEQGRYVTPSLGGLVGQNSGTIAGSYAKGKVIGKVGKRGGSEIGGLAGVNYGSIDGSYSTATVSGGVGGGGLVGTNVGQITNSFATGSVEGYQIGGLVDVSAGTIINSFATGMVSVSNAGSNWWGGGLVGAAGGPISNSYATGNVQASGTADVGGLVGINDSTINASYSTGMVSAGAGSFVGGLIGDDESELGNLDATYWDTDTSGITDPSQGAGNIANDPGITGLTTAQFQSGLPQGFDPAVWNESANTNEDLPYLLSNPPHGHK